MDVLPSTKGGVMILLRKLYCKDCHKVMLHIIYCQKVNAFTYVFIIIFIVAYNLWSKVVLAEIQPIGWSWIGRLILFIASLNLFYWTWKEDPPDHLTAIGQPMYQRRRALGPSVLSRERRNRPLKSSHLVFRGSKGDQLCQRMIALLPDGLNQRRK